MEIRNFLFGTYPYIALTVFLLGSWIRFDREQYTWKTDSSQLLSRAGMRLGSNLFHVGILMIFLGHVAGLVMPHGLWLWLGVSDMAHQWLAIIAGTVFGMMCLVGGTILWLRRVGNARVRAAGRKNDLFVLSWLMLTLILGLVTIPFSIGHANHNNPEVMLSLSHWVQSILTLSPDPGLLDGVDPIFRTHIFFGMTVFLIFPFTRLVHVWSVPFAYLTRSYQIVRTKRRITG